jgi:hypothetical protein
LRLRSTIFGRLGVDLRIGDSKTIFGSLRVDLRIGDSRIHLRPIGRPCPRSGSPINQIHDMEELINHNLFL